VIAVGPRRIVAVESSKGAAGAKHACRLPENRQRLGDMAHRRVGNDGVNAGVGNVERLRALPGPAR
jgi:hypothetical protein